MSDGGSGAGGGATFSQPSSPTTGLQRYNLEGSPKNLNPAIAQKWRGRLFALRRDQARRASSRQNRGGAALQKDSSMLRGTIEAMVETLSKSAETIRTAGGENAEELSKRSRTEFVDALISAIEADAAAEMAKRAPVEEPLYKGLGTVGRVANLLGTIAPTIQAIKAGFDNKWQMPCEGNKDAAPNDPASANVTAFLDQVVSMAELTLRAAVNEHVELADDADLAEGASLPPGLHLIMVPDGDDPKTGAVVKTMLPEGLAKLATDPDVLDDGKATLGLEMLVSAGVPEEALGKIFAPEVEDLSKAFPPKKKQPDSGADDSNAGDQATGAGQADAGADPNAAADEGATGDPSGADDQMGDPNGDDPLAVLLRILAAAMIQANHIQEVLTGGATADDTIGTTPDDGTNTSAPDSGFGKSVGKMGLAKVVGGGAAPAGDPLADLRKSFDAELAKRDETITEMAKGIQLLLSQPAPAKGVTLVTTDLLKQHDTGSGANRAPTAEELNEELNKLAPEERTLALIKIAQKMPEPNHRQR